MQNCHEKAKTDFPCLALNIQYQGNLSFQLNRQAAAKQHMKRVLELLTLALSINSIAAAYGQSVLVYDNQISVVNNGRVNDPNYPVFLMYADSFSLASNAVVNEASWLGAYKTSDAFPNGEDDFTILFFAFKEGIPATTPFAGFTVGAAERHPTLQTLPYGYHVFSYSAQFPDLLLPEGTYLIAIMNNPAETTDWMWADADAPAGNSYMMLFEGTPWREASGGGVAEFAFSISYLPDTSPPRIVNIEATPKALWPPNHRMVPINVLVDAVDDRDPSPATHIVQVSSNEPQGDKPDWEITGPLSLNLRAERSGSKEGRIYTIVVECKDSSGNVTYAPVDVIVSHDRR